MVRARARVAEGGVPKEFGFQRAPERFHGGIVIAGGFAAHTGGACEGFAGVPVVSAGILAATVDVDDDSTDFATVAAGSVQSFADQHGDQVQPSIAGICIWREAGGKKVVAEFADRPVF